jgi:two-component system chemotaxis sensor kinase CheA
MQEKEMLHDLVLESKEHLLSIEPDLLQLERSGNDVDDELINRIFRAIHSIKGGFGFFGIDKVTRLSHSMENILSRIRDHDLEINSPVIDALLQGIDKLRVLIDDISNCDSIPIEQELEKLSPFRSNTELKEQINKDTAAQSPSITLLENHPDISEAQLEDASKNGKHVYIIILNDLNLHSSGTDLSEIYKEMGKIRNCY